MRMRFDYRTCQVQEARVTFVNGEWQGRMAPSRDHAAESLESCPSEWEYLIACGAEGWELVAVAGGVGGESNVRMLYLRKEHS